jgi:hypothetical protein
MSVTPVKVQSLTSEDPENVGKINPPGVKIYYLIAFEMIA